MNINCKNCGLMGGLEESGLCYSCDKDFKEKFLNNIFPNKEVKAELSLEDFDKIKETIRKVYPKIIKVLKEYCDLNEKYYNIVALWVLGTYMHKGFLSYPYLYFNAMRGSGKSRLLNLIKTLSYNGELLVSMSESVLFRTAKNHTFCIDEFEGVASRDKGTLRELLNAGYKKGMLVKRTKKVKNERGEEYETEKFEVFCPIAMANIWGMEEVLSDRCITLILEKSNDPYITKLMELYDFDDNINYIKDTLYTISVVNAVKFTLNNVYRNWNYYIKNYTLYTTYIHTTYNTNYIKEEFFNKIKKANIDSRNLELFFPLFLVSSLCSEEILDETIKTAKYLIKSKKEDDIIENRDVSLIEFLSNKEESDEFIPISNILIEFKEYLKEGDESSKYINSKWLGRALKRLNFINEKRRLGKGIEVKIDFKKARKQILLFKDKPKEEKLEVIEEIKMSGSKNE